MGRGEVSDAARLEKNLKPRLPLDHIIKERYPTFVDALRDLDDALSMLFLFANLPSTTTIPPKTIVLCQRLCLEFQHYLIVSHSLKKSFLSIKGIYYQATIQGQNILWLVPYRFVQKVTGDIDFRIMGTFVEFYTTLLGFVNFRLYTSIGLVYPPKFNSSSDERGGELRAMTLQGKSIGNEMSLISQANSSNDAIINGVSRREDAETEGGQPQSNEHLEIVVRQIAATEEQPAEEQVQEDNNNNNEEAIDVFEAPISADADILPQPFLSTSETASLFAPFTFFLSRETPRQPLEFLLRAFGCNRIGWGTVLGDGAFTNDEADPSITHQVVDRPPMPMDAENMDNTGDENNSAPSRRANTRYPGRTYIQPQWVWDCVNAGKLLRLDLYAPGAELPPHLSPWVKPSKGQYDPTIPLEEQEREGEAEEEEEEKEEEEEEEEEEDEGVEEDSVEKRNNLSSQGLELDHVTDDEENGGMDFANDEASEKDEAVNEATSHKEQEQEQNDTDWEGFSDGDEAIPVSNQDKAHPDDNDEVEEDEDEDVLHQRELEAEMAGVPVSSIISKGQSKTSSEQRKKAAAAKRRRAEEEEELERQKMMMSRKKRKTLEKMLYSNRKKDEEAAALRRKRRKIEKAKNVA